jgi:2-C-methyl-D-erythritol 2,4-cyclodiphosphate synthase
MTEEHDHEYRTGIGTDIHPLVAGRKLKLGGIEIPHPMGLSGHSDGDVVIHSVIDALLGAAGMGDIGTLFPDEDPQYAEADSREFLVVIKDKLAEKRWEVVNVDLIIHAGQPRMEPYKGQIKRCIAELLSIDFNAVNVKAKTDSGFGDVGTGDAIAATTAVLLKRKYKRTL